MPYVAKEKRQYLRPKFYDPARNSGELNYQLTAVIQQYLHELGKVRDIRYTDLNDVIGALEGAKLEFYRRVVVPYETTKIEINGDVSAPQ